MREAFICDGIRTPIGRYGGALSGVRADDLAAIPLRELLVRNPRLDAECIDDVILGCANQAGEDNRNVARMATLLAGLPQSVSGTTINRLCGSGLDALGFAARAIKAGDGDLLIAGGVESMSRAPFVMGKATSAFSRQAEMFDTTIGWRFVNPLMAQQFGTDSMPETAENVAELLKMDVIELNEAFAAQALGVLRELGLPDDAPHVNPNGGAIALGHPLGMSGARLALAASHELHRRNGRYALCTMCIGVGQGIAMILERV